MNTIELMFRVAWPVAMNGNQARLQIQLPLCGYKLSENSSQVSISTYHRLLRKPLIWHSAKTEYF